jgi:hypothetical protein
MEEKTKWTEKRDELEYKMGLVNRYMDLKKLAMPDKQILSLFPEMKVVVDSHHAGDGGDDDGTANGDAAC